MKECVRNDFLIAFARADGFSPFKSHSSEKSVPGSKSQDTLPKPLGEYCFPVKSLSFEVIKNIRMSPQIQQSLSRCF